MLAFKKIEMKIIMLPTVTVKPLRARLAYAGLAMLLIFVIGSVGYYLIGHGEWSFLDCAYMTIITISTVGYSEILDMTGSPEARVFTMALIVMGMGIAVYFISSITAFIVEGELRNLIWRNRMAKALKKMHDHIIVCGAGETGMYIIKELQESKCDFVVIDRDEQRLRRLQERFHDAFPVVIGEATDDEILQAARVEEARGVISALTRDKDNIFVVISVRTLNPKARIIAKGIQQNVADKLLKAGADRVVQPNLIGGMRLASEMIRPEVVTFLDTMMSDKDRNLRLEEVTLSAKSNCLDKPLKETDIRKIADLLVLSVRDPETGKFHYNPGANYILRKGMTLVVLGEVDSVQKFRKLT